MIADKVDDRAMLVALRDRLAAEIDATKSPRILAMLARSFMMAIKALHELKAPATSRVDEIAKRREARRRRAAGDTDTANS